MRQNIYRTIEPDEEIWLYKKGSRGEVVGKYKSVKDIVELERLFNKRFAVSGIYMALHGQTKSFVSFNHQCRVRPVIRKINDITETDKKG